jgi:hypothetical protein
VHGARLEDRRTFNWQGKNDPLETGIVVRIDVQVSRSLALQIRVPSILVSDTVHQPVAQSSPVEMCCQQTSIGYSRPITEHMSAVDGRIRGAVGISLVFVESNAIEMGL